MMAHCSHDSVCVQCPADGWERSLRPCDANSQAAQRVSWVGVTTATGTRGDEDYLESHHSFVIGK